MTNLSRLALLTAVAALASCSGEGDGGQALREGRPNVVFVLLDDARYDDLVDHPFAELPNIERLAREGASFRNFFTSAPLCSPSRAVFMTGQYPYRNGIIDNGERAEQSHRIVTFPKLLHDAGYRTGFFGKWHMGHEDDSPRPGFDRWVSFVGQGVYFDPELNVDGVSAQGEGYTTDILTDSAVSFIRAAPDDEPFLVVVAQKAVHPEIFPDFVRTFPPAPGDETLYEGREPPHGPNWRAPTTGKPALSRPVDYSDPRSPEGGLPDDIIMDRLRMLSAVDRGVGRLIEALEARGVLDETVFVITSDQGFFYGEFGLAQERRLAYEPSIHVPLIVRYPARDHAHGPGEQRGCRAHDAGARRCPHPVGTGRAVAGPRPDRRRRIGAGRHAGGVLHGHDVPAPAADGVQGGPDGALQVHPLRGAGGDGRAVRSPRRSL